MLEVCLVEGFRSEILFIIFLSRGLRAFILKTYLIKVSKNEVVYINFISRVLRALVTTLIVVIIAALMISWKSDRKYLFRSLF